MSKKSTKPQGKTAPAPRSAPLRNQQSSTGSPVKAFVRRHRFAIILFCLTFIVFGNAITNGYALDDEFYTAGSNQLTQKGLRGIPAIFKTRTFYNNDGSGYSYRPVALASFALEIQLFGEKPHVSHFINVLLYALTMVLLFRLLRRWFTTQGDWFSFFICLLFLVHPLHTEVVDNIKCRDELLSFLFAMLSIRFVWDFVEARNKWSIGAAAVMFVLSMLSKPTSIILVPLIPITVWYWSNKKWWTGILYVLPMLVLLWCVKSGASTALPDMKREFQDFENPLQTMSRGQLFATASYVIGRYFWLQIIPHPLVFYYGLNEVPICQWSDVMVIFGLIVFLALAALTLYELRKKTVAGFGLLWFLGNVLMVSNLFGAAPGIMAERFVYSASLGFIIAAVDYTYRAFKMLPADFEWKAKTSKNIKYVFIIAALIFSVRSIARNEAWEDKETLYRNDVEVAPNSAKINMLLGSLLSSQGAELNFNSQRHMQAAQQYAAYSNQLKAANQPGAENYMRMASLQQDSGKMLHEQAYALFGEAREYYRQATEIFPNYYTAWSNLGTAYYFTRDYRGGIPFFKRALTIKDDYSEAYFNLGMSYEQMSKRPDNTTDTALLDSSFYFFELGLKKDSSYVNSADQLSRMIFQYRHDSAVALSVLNKCAIDNPKSAVPWNAMSNIYFQTKDTASGVAALEMAAKLEPDNFNRLNNLSKYFARIGNTEKSNYYLQLYNDKYTAYQKKLKLLGKETKR